MRISKNTLNNLMMENQRRTPVYQTIITDLAIAGAIELDVAEALLGYKIPGFLHTPDGKCLKAEEEKPAKKASSEKEEKAKAAAVKEEVTEPMEEEAKDTEPMEEEAKDTEPMEEEVTEPMEE